MSHAAPSLSGLPPRQSTSGVTTRKFWIAEPRLSEPTPGTLCVDTVAQQLHIDNTNRSVKVRLHLRAKLNERISIPFFPRIPHHRAFLHHRVLVHRALFHHLPILHHHFPAFNQGSRHGGPPYQEPAIICSQKSLFTSFVIGVGEWG